MRQHTGGPRLGIFVVCTFLFWFTLYTYVPTMTPYLVNLGISYSMIGFIGGAYGFSQMLLRIPLGLASDRLGKRKIFLVLGLLIGAVSSFGMFFTRNAVLILALRLLAGVSASAWVVFTVLFSSYFEKERLASRMSYLLTANNCGVLFAKLAGSALAERFGHEYSFLLGGAAGLAAALLSLSITEKMPVLSEPPSLKKLLGVVRDRNLLAMSALAVFSQMILFATIVTFTPEAAARAGADSLQLGILGTVATVPAIVSSLLGSRLFAKRVNVRGIVALGFALSAFGTLIVPFAGSMAAVYVSAIAVGFGCGICMSTLLSFCTLTVDDGRRSAAMGFYQAVYGLGMFAGPVLVGFFVDWTGLSGGFFAAAALAMLGLALTYVLLRPSAKMQ